MITIPKYVYNDNTIEFVCPDLEMAREALDRSQALEPAGAGVRHRSDPAHRHRPGGRPAGVAGKP